MKWYYSKDGQQAGPVDDAEFARLIAQGLIRPDTLVWKEGMPQWQPYSSVASPAGASAPSSPPPTQGTPQTTCSVCGQPAAAENSLMVGGRLICPTCKPSYVQSLKEGTLPEGVGTSGRYAGFWIRFAAYIVDQLILAAVSIPLMMIVGLGGISIAPGQFNNPDQFGKFFAVQAGLQLLQWIVVIVYQVFFVYKYSATPGKLLCRIRIVRADEQPLSLGLCVGRAFGHMLSGLTCGIGFLMAAFDDQKRTLHDRMCNTRVVTRD